MRLQKNDFLNIGDTLISDVFITDYLLDLSKEATAVYMVLQHLYQKQKTELTLEQLSQQLGFDQAVTDSALDELLKLGLVSLENNDLWLTDLKKDIITRRYRSVEDAAMRYSSQQADEREQVIRQINDTFGQGLMSMRLLDAYGEVFARYDFEPEVVYALAREVHVKLKIKNSTRVLLDIAHTWHEAGIKKYSQLEQYMAQREEFKTIAKKFRKQLGLYDNLTLPQENQLRKWLYDYGYDFDVIKLAIDQASKNNRVTFAYLDTVISEWHRLNLKTLEDVERHRTEHIKSRSTNKTNFAERTIGRVDEKEQHLQELLRLRQQQNDFRGE